jgi:ABC-type polysaccharide/polyol phosphate transport system ATPase subunit
MTSIIVKNLTLDYPINGLKNTSEDRNSAVGGRIIFNGKAANLRALDDVSFKIEKGDRVALIGHNGAGKSTLLKVMAGIYKSQQGEVIVDGKVAPLFNLKFGMDNELSGYENIILRGLYLGFSLKEIKGKRTSIVELSELGDFIHMPIKTYSSGMLARLAFAISTSVDADILLLDEMIGTGDANFINKAKSMIDGFISNSNILVLASHSNKVLREICNKAILFEHGRLVTGGHIEDVLTVYRYKIELEKEKSKRIVKGMKRALLINDTGNTKNIGCRAVKKSIISIIKETAIIVESIPVGYGQEHFELIASKSRDWIDKASDIPKQKVYTPLTDYDEWNKIRKKVFTNDQYIKRHNEFDVIIVNAEGSIHHDSKRALTLLAQIQTFKELGKKVIVLNATIQDMSHDILRNALQGVDVIHVRERYTLNYLKGKNIDAFLSDDIASIYISSSPNYVINSFYDEQNKCLLSQGVLANKTTIKKSIDVIRKNNLVPYYLSMGDGNEDDVAKSICQDMNVKFISAESLQLEDVSSFLKQFKLVISGRHHLNLFALNSGVKLICLPSNTLKIEGTLDLYEYNIPLVYDYNELERVVSELRKFKAYKNGNIDHKLINMREELFRKVNDAINSI